MQVAMTHAELHEIQHKSIQVLAEGIGQENYLIRNEAALCNFQCDVCLSKIKTLCCHSLNFYQDELDPPEHTKRTLVQTLGKEDLNFEDLQEGSN